MSVPTSHSAPAGTADGTARVPDLRTSPVLIAIAALIWLYILVKIFLFDIDAYLLATYAPQYSWILGFKWLGFLCIAALCGLLAKREVLLRRGTYILLFPLFILLWHMPRLVFKVRSPVLAIAIVNGLLSFVLSLRRATIFTAIFLAASVTVVYSTNKIFLIVACIIIILLAFWAYIRRFIEIFRPSRVFGIYVKAAAGLRRYWDSQYKLDTDTRGLPAVRMSSSQLEKWTTSLETALMLNRTCLYVARQLRDYEKSKLTAVSSAVSVLFLTFLVIVAFALASLALYKIDPSSFALQGRESTFGFMYYSFNLFVFNNIEEIRAISPWAQTLAMLEGFLAITLVVILATLIMSVKSQRQTEEITRSIVEIEAEGEKIETLIRDDYKLNSVEEALREINRLKTGLSKLLLALSEQLK
jgi:hypothetical protein